MVIFILEICMNTVTKGAIGLQNVILETIKKGYIPSLPAIEGTRYDLIIDTGKELKRVQVKYCDYIHKSGAYTVGLNKHNGGYNRKIYTYSSEEIDAVIVYIPKKEIFLWMDSEEINHKTSMSFRDCPGKNGQSKNINLISDYIWRI